MKVDVIMPMLGRGERMENCQNTCKPLMCLPDGERFFIRALRSLKNYKIRNLVMVVLEDFGKEFFELSFELSKEFSIDEIIIVTHAPTKNAVETLKIGVNQLNLLSHDNLPTIVLDCDIYGELPLVEQVFDANIFYFSSNNPNKSYIETDSEGMVVNIAEKIVISDKAVMGAYFFGSLSAIDPRPDFAYVSDLIKQMIKEGKRVSSLSVGKVTNFGTLQELKEL